LCQMLAPVLSFTADEAWGFVPKRAHGFVQATSWSPATLQLTHNEQEAWRRLFAIRDLVLPALEGARQQKLIGKSLDAALTLSLPADDLGVAEAHIESLRELLNVSQLSVKLVPEEKERVEG